MSEKEEQCRRKTLFREPAHKLWKRRWTEDSSEKALEDDKEAKKEDYMASLGENELPAAPPRTW